MILDHNPLLESGAATCSSDRRSAATPIHASTNAPKTMSTAASRYPVNNAVLNPVENCYRQCADFQRKNFAHSQVSRARSCQGDEKNNRPSQCLRLCGQQPCLKKPAGQREENASQTIGDSNHFFPANCVKQMPEQHRAEHISQREGQEIAAHILLGHLVKSHQNQRVSEEDRVIEESLCQHQHKTEERTPAMFVYDRVPNFLPRRVCTCTNACGPRVAIAAGGDRGRM